jgi:hypothetical protein|tara:strand:+ start:752 stop:964 length:213 start_codon:yes stop_codon:yes gene_type:complete
MTTKMKYKSETIAKAVITTRYEIQPDRTAHWCDYGQGYEEKRVGATEKFTHYVLRFPDGVYEVESRRKAA